MIRKSLLIKLITTLFFTFISMAASAAYIAGHRTVVGGTPQTGYHNAVSRTTVNRVYPSHASYRQGVYYKNGQRVNYMRTGKYYKNCTWVPGHTVNGRVVEGRTVCR